MRSLITMNATFNPLVLCEWQLVMHQMFTTRIIENYTDEPRGQVSSELLI